MKYYLLLLATFVVICVGCVSNDGQRSLLRDDVYTAPPPSRLQQQGSSLHDSHLCPQRIEYTGELDPDVASSDDNQALR